MSIWFQSPDLEDVNRYNKATLVEVLEITVTKMEKDHICGAMPVTSKTIQPHQMLHGGASCVLGETLGSIASNLCVDQAKFHAVGQHIEMSHIKAVPLNGHVHSKVTIIHLGSRTHIWDIKIFNENDQLVSSGKLTCAVIKKK